MVSTSKVNPQSKKLNPSKQGEYVEVNERLCEYKVTQGCAW